MSAHTDKSSGTGKADFRALQKGFTRHLRDPAHVSPPEHIEDRRMGIYRDLIYNNIESFIDGAFPVLRSITPDARWHNMVRGFVRGHLCHSPYFLEISEEFLKYLQDEYRPDPEDPPFLLELAHYEWVELALDVNPADFPQEVQTLAQLEGDVMACTPVVSPLVWSLCYRFPVHQIGPQFQPREAPETPSFLFVYRNRADEVGFMEANAATARLLQLAQEGNCSGYELLQALAEEMQHPDPAALTEFGQDLITKLLRLDILAGLQRS